MNPCANPSLPLLAFPKDFSSFMPSLPVGPHMPQPAKDLLSLPFDTARAQYANAVRCGLVARSLLASARFERHLDTLEKLSYGPFARRV